MNKKLDFKGIIIVSLVLLFLIYLVNFILKCEREKTEGFQSESGTKFKDITGEDLMNQRYERARQELVLDTVENSIDRSIEKQGQLTFENADTNSELMDKYINSVIKIFL